MSFYRLVDVRIHGDEKYLRLSPDLPSGRALFKHLLICQENGPLPGVVKAGAAALAEALEWLPEQLRERFEELLQEGLAEADWKARLIFLPNAIRYNPPNNPNVVAGWSKHWDALPDGPLKVRIWTRYHEFFLEDKERREREQDPGATRKQMASDAFLVAFLRAIPMPPGTVTQTVPATVPLTVAGTVDGYSAGAGARLPEPEEESNSKSKERRAREGREPKPQAQDPESEFCLGVEVAFQEATGTARPLSPTEGRLVCSWYDRGIPLWIVEEVLREMMARKNAKRGKPLAYYAEAVEERFEEHRKLTATAAPVSLSTSEARASPQPIESPVWSAAKQHLAQTMEVTSYRDFIRPLQPTADQNGSLTLCAPSDLIKSLVEEEFLGLIEQASGKKIVLTC